MAFDLSTAVEVPSGFDLSTAVPIVSATPTSAKAPFEPTTVDWPPPGMDQPAPGGEVERELSSILGGAFAPGTLSTRFLPQADIARGVNLAARQKKFQTYFPQGELISVPTETGGLVELGRTSKEAPYQRLSALPQVAGAMVSEPVVGGVMGSFLGPWGTAIGTATGVLTQRHIEKQRGYEETLGLKSALGEGAIAGGVDVATRRILRAFGRGPPRYVDVPDPVTAAKELGLEHLAIGQVSLSPFVRGTYRQVGATSGRIERQVDKQERSLLEDFRAETGAGASDEMLDRVVAAQTKELNQFFKPGQLTRPEAGLAVQEGIATYKKASGRLVARYYAKAEAVSADVRFNIAPAQRLAGEIETGVLAAGRTTQKPSLVLGPEGGPAFFTETIERVRVSQPARGELADVIATIKQLDPTIARLQTERGTFGPFEQIKSLRTRLWDLKQSDDPMVRREGTRLWNTLSESMYKPISANPQAVAAFRKAAAANTIREQSLEKAFIVRALQTDTPEQIARQYLHPGSFSALNTLRGILPKKSWGDLRNAFKADLAREETASAGLRRLENFSANDPGALQMLLPGQELNNMRAYLQAKQRFETGPIRAVLDRNLTAMERGLEIMNRGTAQDINNFVRLSGGANSQGANALRGAVYKELLDSSMEVSRMGVEVINSGKLIANINKWQTSGKLEQLFRPTDWQKLKQFRTYAIPVSESGDIGGPMMAGGLRQRWIQAATDIPQKGLIGVAMGTLRPLWSNEITATILSRTMGVGARLGLPGATDPYRQAAIILTNTAQQMSGL